MNLAELMELKFIILTESLQGSVTYISSCFSFFVLGP